MRTFCIFFFSLSFRYFGLVNWSCNHLVIVNLVFIFYIFDKVVITFLPVSPCVVYFLSLCTCFLFSVCNLLFLFHTKIP